ncbi:hypothetical protein CVD25_20465 [Bacillus canaveralius]|uniref:Uncharacterized protein n=1 Tax=Bacillus canaveralius TaxID=1403243 RepID=A0A2N5GJM2_9BACI|nr:MULTISPECIES: hypothetical protein [Bacillus]PLR80535.1 hypothetical protein CVD23_20810 [Bacillus sp. V33-4]PLR81402.1 hypothetical protein CU635_15060 [Bacillus canaveralius]PLR90058.1 hypothetical protein CVD25_20465 [Bacillus canaveralius]
MSLYMTILMAIGTGLIVFAAAYTYSLAKAQKNSKDGHDSPLPRQVQQHVYIRNPIFLSYLIFFALLILTIIYMAFATEW